MPTPIPVAITPAMVASRKAAATRARRRVVRQMREAMRTIEHAAEAILAAGSSGREELDRQVSVLRSASERLDLEAE